MVIKWILFWNIKEIGKWLINTFIYYQIDIITVNGDKRNMTRRSKMRLICQTGMVSTTVLDDLHVSIHPYRKIIDNWIEICESWFFVYFLWLVKIAGMVFCYLVWMILSILEGLCNGIGYVYLYFSMLNKYFVSA